MEVIKLQSDLWGPIVSSSGTRIHIQTWINSFKYGEGGGPARVYHAQG